MLEEFKRSMNNPKGFYDPVTLQTTSFIYNNATSKGKRLLDDILDRNRKDVII